MSSVAYMRNVVDGTDYGLFSEQPFERIVPLIKHIANLENLLDLSVHLHSQDYRRMYYIHIIVGRPLLPNSSTDDFDAVFPREFLDEHLQHSSNDDGSLVRSSFVLCETSAFETMCDSFKQKLEDERVNRERCLHAFEASDEVYTNSFFHRLATEYNLQGGNWLVYFANRNKQTRAPINEDAQRNLSIIFVKGIVQLLKNDQLDPQILQAFKSFQWMRCVEDKRISYLVKITNQYSNYLYHDSYINKSRCELYYFYLDLQVNRIYRALAPLFDKNIHSLRYKLDVVSACNLNKRSATDSFIICLYPSLIHANMLITKYEELLKAFKNSDDHETRFGDPKKTSVHGII